MHLERTKIFKNFVVGESVTVFRMTNDIKPPTPGLQFNRLLSLLSGRLNKLFNTIRIYFYMNDHDKI